ncbi:MAG TPA: twin-arginine translocase TatA/TatE family subunit [Bacteroidota bacterium]|nr:twin-arginine translocase TatA/TatE family subunit [Bacteroidota bacterium]
MSEISFESTNRLLCRPGGTGTKSYCEIPGQVEQHAARESRSMLWRDSVPKRFGRAGKASLRPTRRALHSLARIPDEMSRQMLGVLRTPRKGAAALTLERCIPTFDTDIVRERSRRVMLEDLSPAKILIIVLLLVVFFGAKKIPEIAQGLGKGMREFRKATREATGPDDESTSPPVSAAGGSATVPCFYCNSPVDRNARFCPSCGQSLEPRKCTRCATVNQLGNKFCSNCGEPL